MLWKIKGKLFFEYVNSFITFRLFLGLNNPEKSPFDKHMISQSYTIKKDLINSWLKCTFSFPNSFTALA